MPHPYSGTHSRERANAIAVMLDGTSCRLCGLPMNKNMPLDYNHITPLILGGPPRGPRELTHARCNRSQGARLGNRRRGFGTRRLPKRRILPRWLRGVHDE